ncbi:MAG: endopeptidase [Bacillota bacterium]|nr:endopeptidase [Bacillota bacterium]MDK2882073.1 endopeptidase [Bacillota bacterium]MDK2960194.1 endopeptidase [Bacillota bacterium]
MAGLFALLYLYFTLFPGPVDPAAQQYFSAAEIAAGRRYAQAKRLIFLASFAVEVGVVAWLVLGPAGGRLAQVATRLGKGRPLAAGFLFFLALWLLLRAVNLPFSLYSSYFLEHQWGFSTESLAGWWADYLKGAALDLVLSGAGVLLFFWATGRWPQTWWLYAGTFLAVWLVVANYLWPVLVAPLFNRFTPVRDPEIVIMVKRLAERADLSVDKVLVMDASRRTTKANAYFAGLGRTRRIVLYDTLLRDYSSDEVEAVVAHEMAHWKLGHVRRGTIYGILANFALWLLLFLLLRLTLDLPRRGPYPPETWALVVLFFLLTSFLGSPITNVISRRMETAADSYAVKLTGDPQAAVRLQVNLARRASADISPPPFIEWFSYTHPSTLRRIEAIRAVPQKEGRP